MENKPLQSVPDDELLHRLAELMSQSRRVEGDIVAHIAEVEERRLYAREAFPSMFAYCMTVLHLSESEAYLRIAAARASRKHPMLLAMLSDGRLHLTAIAKLARHLTCENRGGLLERATHRSRRQIEKLIAEIAPRPDAPCVVRKLPDRKRLTDGLGVPDHGEGPVLGLRRDPLPELRPNGVAAPEREEPRGGDALGQRAVHPQVPDVARATTVPVLPSAAHPGSHPPVTSPVPPAIVQPLSPGRYKVQFTASTEFKEKLELLLALVGSRVPDCDLAAVVEQAVTEKLERLEARRFGRTKARKGHAGGIAPASQVEKDSALASSPSSRRIPAAVRRAVRDRDRNRCQYVNDQGSRCPERYQLEFHHRRPFGFGGGHSVANIGLLCRAHNAYMADGDYGRKKMASHRRGEAT